MSADYEYLGPMTPMQRAEFLTYARSTAFSRMVDQARRIRDAGFDRAPDAYTASSFGKDSNVLLHLVLEAKPDADVRFVRWPRETPHLNNYDDVVGAWCDRFGVRLRTLELERKTLADRVSDRWEQMERLAPADGYFVGMRMAGEGKGRRHSIMKLGEVYRMKGGLWRITPLAWWTSREIAAYTLMHDLPTLESYAVEGWDSRTAARVPRVDGGVRRIAMQRLKARRPEGFAALCREYPELQEFA